MRSLTETLESKQVALGMDDAAFAARLGISRPLWSMLRRGKRRPGQKVISGVVRAFPGLADDALVYLRDKPFSLSENGTVSDVESVTQAKRAGQGA